MDLRSSDLELFDAWKKATGPDKDRKLVALLTQLDGAIMTAARTYMTAPLPFTVLQVEARRQALEALRSFDPGRGVPLTNYLITTVKQRLSRYVIQHQNVARIPEAKVQLIGPLREAETELSNRFGREPTTHELADHLNVSVAHITKVRKMQRADILESSADFHELAEFEHDANYERIMLAYYSLPSDLKPVFDYSLGAHGCPRLSPGEMASKLGLSSVQISQKKKKLAEQLGAYLA